MSEINQIAHRLLGDSQIIDQLRFMVRTKLRHGLYFDDEALLCLRPSATTASRMMPPWMAFSQ